MPVTLQIKDYVATVTLDRPEAMNSLDPESIEQLKDIWAEISRNPQT
jgi:E-phenylitaconyl-CoA hydratase